MLALASYIYARTTPDFHAMPNLYRRNGCFSSFSQRSRARKCYSIEWDIRHVDIRFALKDNRTGYLDAMSIQKEKVMLFEVYFGYFYAKCRANDEKSIRVTLNGNSRVWNMHRSVILTRFSSASFVPSFFDRPRA